MRTLNISKGFHDLENKFKVEGVRGEVSLQQDYLKEGDGVLWGLQSGTMIKSFYSEEEKQHKKRMSKYLPIVNGELILINGQVYRAEILGDYSDCVIFKPVE
ncbi:hypothetical protein COL77_30605 [Bacillus wiedmannii]|uniref:hypothetical protein n=1 Tax=Bacillus wiedmannii TaxID=1890302 RepID=UPI000BF263CB|nr:hypothetical protein [Bacillus wiedmannii]PFZ33872.1 hypothetical protein COL77_30605 [Bacillus wiedmannii]